MTPTQTISPDDMLPLDQLGRGKGQQYLRLLRETSSSYQNPNRLLTLKRQNISEAALSNTYSLNRAALQSQSLMLGAANLPVIKQ